MANRELKIAAHFNTDSRVLKVQVYVTDPCDAFYHPEDVISGTVQLFNVYNLPETGLQEVPLEQISFDKTNANSDGFFAIFFANPAMTTNLEARATLELANQGIVTALTSVINEAGAFTGKPSTSVVGNATNRSWHLDLEPQRDEPFLDEAPHNEPALGANQVVIPDPTIVQKVYADIQFEQLAEMKSSAIVPGQLVYLGGGGRLLPKPGLLVKQNLDIAPWELGASTFVEQAANQILPNNSYVQLTGNIPTGYTMDSPGIAIVESTIQKLQGEGFDAKAWSLQVNGASPVSITPFSTASLGLTTPVAFDITKPIALSLLAGLEKRAEESDITTASLKLQFYDFADRELTAKVIALDPTELFNARPLKPFSIQAIPSEYPATVEKVTWRLEIGSVDQGDYIVIRTAVPSLTQTPFATSQVLSGESRVQDNLSFIPSTAFALEEGAAVFSIAIGFTEIPTETKYIFDTRDPISLQNGIALRTEATGELTLLIDNGGSSHSITSSSPIAWVGGQVFEIVAEWSVTDTLLRISVDGSIVIEDSATALPTGLDALSIDAIQLGANANIQEPLDSEILRAVFLKRPR